MLLRFNRFTPLQTIQNNFTPLLNENQDKENKKDTSLDVSFLVRHRGFEPRTPCLKGRCSAD